MNVCWLSNYFSPYALKQFELIGKEVNLTVLILGGNDGNRNDEWSLHDNPSFKVVYIDKNYKKSIKELAKTNDIFIDSLYSSKYGIYATHCFKRLNKKTILQADGGVPIDRGFVINKLISIIMKRHDYFLSSGPHCDRYFGFYKVNQEKIHHYRFSSLMEKDVNEHKKLLSKKEEYRKQLGIDDKFTLISVGRPIKLKGFDVLLNAYIKTGLTDKINLYIVGGKPQDEIKNIVDENNLSNVHFIGLLSTPELNKYYVASDTFVLCTKTDVWGLVLNESMSFGLPVITSNNCGAGVHFSLLGDNVITCGIEDVDEYAKQITKLYNNKELVKQLGNKSLEMIKEYTIENSCKDIIKALNEI